MAGDYNIIPQDDDAARPEVWQEDALGPPRKPCGVSRDFEPWIHRSLPGAKIPAAATIPSGITRQALMTETMVSVLTITC